MSSSVVAAEHRVCDQKHEEQQRQSDGAEEFRRRYGEADAGAKCGCTFRDGQKAEIRFILWFSQS